MKRQFLFVLSLSLIVILGIGLFWLSQSEVAEAQSNKETPHPLAAINQKAVDARTGNQTAAEDLVGEIICVAAFENELEGFTTDDVKERVGTAESRYRQGLSAGIPVEKIARTVNGLAYKFNLPKYAKTNVNEVTRLRFMETRRHRLTIVAAAAADVENHERAMKTNFLATNTKTSVWTLRSVDGYFFPSTLRKRNFDRTFSTMQKHARYSSVICARINVWASAKIEKVPLKIN